jgi:hypothetical protein
MQVVTKTYISHSGEYFLHKFTCSCDATTSDEHIFVSCDGQRDINIDKVMQIKDSFKKECELSPLITCVKEFNTFYMYDGQHRYTALKLLCLENIHVNFTVQYIEGTRESAFRHYSLQTLALPHTHQITSETSREIIQRNEYIKFMKDTPSINQFLKQSKCSRPYFNCEHLIDVYIQMCGYRTIAEFSDWLATFNHRLSFPNVFVSPLKLDSSPECRHKCYSTGIFFGLMKSVDYKKCATHLMF